MLNALLTTFKSTLKTKLNHFPHKTSILPNEQVVLFLVVVIKFTLVKIVMNRLSIRHKKNIPRMYFIMQRPRISSQTVLSMLLKEKCTEQFMC